MSYIIIPDIDNHIVDMASLPYLVKLLCVNKFFYELVSKKPIVKQWNEIRNKNFFSSSDAFFFHVIKDLWNMPTFCVALKNIVRKQ